ncbi:3-isopropylmalate dehydrogenase [Pseudoflavonifractor sp. AF19-9AC]|uniref:3-isopropylmalate dehydrogenase n=1 Tax=Pseudoflavonifractor sp. AF19-9AC TaxID=2292244 RepID=UPI000E4B426E|nr:3-isopropylmalate dehydrogenase [Pseudoflavonifractor sp. AF19-9AC]RHR08986.1 3-isopropylmalate dehydrogenase [Pseudoflavonifractor sp. AF19-9AC]
MNYKIALIRGDGIGPEVVGEAVKVMDAVGEKFGHTFTYTDVLMGGCAIDAVGKSYPDGTAEACKACDAVLLGAVGGPKWGHSTDPEKRPETALLSIRKDLGLYANLRPAALRPALADACPLKKETADKGIDLMIVRELTGGIYFGKRESYQTEDRGEEAADRMAYSEMEIERIGRRAFELARLRGKKLASVDKANVLETSRLWRKVMHRLAEEYSDVEYSDVLVDNAAMQLVRDPGQFDVVVTENMFGDILSDEASMITGSIGLLPSASIGDTAPGLYEPIHGSAPDIAGQDKANPIATILSVAMMFRYSFQLPEEASAIEKAVDSVLNAGWRTADIAAPGEQAIGTVRMGELIRAQL